MRKSIKQKLYNYLKAALLSFAVFGIVGCNNQPQSMDASSTNTKDPVALTSSDPYMGVPIGYAESDKEAYEALFFKVYRNYGQIVFKIYNAVDWSFRYGRYLVAYHDALGNPSYTNNGQQHVVWRDVSGTIWHRYTPTIYVYNWSGEQRMNFGGVTNAPVAAGDPFVTSFGNLLTIVYRETSGAIQELWYDGSWHNQRLTWTLGLMPLAPPAVGEPHYNFMINPLQQHCVYRDASGAVWHLWYNQNGIWNYQKLNYVGGGAHMTWAPAAAGDPNYGCMSNPSQQHCVYRDALGVIYHLWYDQNGIWHSQPMNFVSGAATPAPAAAGDPYYCGISGSSQHIVYRDASGIVWHLWYDGSNWYHSQVNLGGLVPDAPAAVCDPTFYHWKGWMQDIVYRSADGKCHDICYNYFLNPGQFIDHVTSRTEVE
jgi:hypothetical protein